MSHRTVDEIITDAHQRVATLEQLLEQAKDDRARTFAIAQQQRGCSAGHISRLLGPGVTPDKVGTDIRLGRRLLQIAAWKQRAA